MRLGGRGGGVSARQGPKPQPNHHGCRCCTPRHDRSHHRPGLRPEPGYAPPSPADPDLGEQRLLIPDQRYQAFSLFANVSEFYTSNAALTNGGEQGDWFTAMQFGASWVPRIAGSLYGEVTALQQLYRYADLTGLSFNSLDLGGGLIYVIRELGDLSVFARYNYNLLTNASADDSLYYQQTIRLGLQKPFVFSRAHSATLGFNADLNLDGWPGYALRNRFARLPAIRPT